MPTCPSCKTYFKTLEDEEHIHDCPKCGFSPEDLRERICYDESSCENLDLECVDCGIYQSLIFEEEVI